MKTKIVPAGVPSETALYAAPMSLLMYALLGSSRQLVVALERRISSSRTQPRFDPASRNLPKANDPPPTTIVLDLQATVDIDVPSCDELTEFAQELRTDGITLALARVQGAVREMLDKIQSAEARVAEMQDALAAIQIGLQRAEAVAAAAEERNRSPNN